MGEVTEISWCDATFNPWIGCQKVSPGCDHCYAARDNERRKWVDHWGEPGRAPVYRRTKTWGDPMRWHRKALTTGYRPRVFCASLCDVFDNNVPNEWRSDLWHLIRQATEIRWIILTKRIGNAPKMLPADWPQNFPHVGLMATMVNQEEWDRDFGKLMSVPAAWHGVSAEPLLGRIDMGEAKAHGRRLRWMITGGESGPDRRPLDMDAVRSIRDQCDPLGIAFHHKQNGGLRGKDEGCLVDGREHKAFPAPLAA